MTRAVALDLDLAGAEDPVSAMARLLAIAGHDLKQPLHVALHSIGRALGDDLEPAAARRLAVATSALNRLGYELDDLARLSQTGRALKPDLSRVAISELFATCAEEWQTQAEFCEVALRFRPTHLVVLSDRTMLATILRNLVGNALKFSRRGGRVLIAARSRRDAVMIEVRDNGGGMTPQQLAGIFRAFDRGGRPATTPGLGLGLYIVGETAKMLRHEIDVRSSPGRGTVFRLTVACRSA